MMRNYVGIANQLAVIENKWDDITLDHLAVLDVIVAVINGGNLHKMNDGGYEWHWVSPKLILDALPILRIKDKRCRIIINTLCCYGLVVKSEKSKENAKMFLRLGDNYCLYNPVHIRTEDLGRKRPSTLPLNDQAPWSKTTNKSIEYNKEINSNYKKEILEDKVLMEKLLLKTTRQHVETIIENILEDYETSSEYNSIPEYRKHVVRKINKELSNTQKPKRENNQVPGRKAMSL